jgi:hypothetical protein
MPGAVFGLIPLMLGLFAAHGGLIGQSVTRLTVQDQVILRVPVQPRTSAPRVEWIERKGPKCLPVGAIHRAMLSGDDQVDFIVAGRGRVRAELDEDCPALDFYGGFYLQLRDDRICADRDEIHSREGGSCRIHRFRQLVPKER